MMRYFRVEGTELCRASAQQIYRWAVVWPDRTRRGCGLRVRGWYGRREAADRAAYAYGLRVGVVVPVEEIGLATYRQACAQQ